MRKVITYGTFDMLHHGHIRLLERAKELGDWLIVGITSANYDRYRGKLNVVDSLMQRIENVKATGLADEIIVEEYEGQKIDDIRTNGVDIFAIGSDWVGKFDYLNEYCDVVYLDRTRGVSSTGQRDAQRSFINFGVVGTGRIAGRFLLESKFVSGMEVSGVLDVAEGLAKEYADRHEISFYTTDYSEMLGRVDAVYIASPHDSHYDYAKRAILAKKHVLCEKPMVFTEARAEELFDLAAENGVILMEGLKTLHAPGFQRLVSLAKSREIGEIKSVEATFTKLVEHNGRELNGGGVCGSMAELGSYPALGIFLLLGADYADVRFTSYGKDADLFTKMDFTYKNAVATAKVGLGVKAEGSMVIAGTRGYIYVPAPWWKTEYFEARFEDPEKKHKYYYEFVGDGLRYEIVEFLNQIAAGEVSPISRDCSVNIAKLMERYFAGGDTRRID